MRKMDSKKLPDTICVRKGEKDAHFRAHYLFWPKMFFGPKQWKPGKTIKIVVSAEIDQNQKWPLKKNICEKGVLLTVFFKAVFFWKPYFYGVFSKTQQLQ